MWIIYLVLVAFLTDKALGENQLSAIESTEYIDFTILLSALLR